MTLVHHDLCFGCGRTNLFGLLAELDRRGDDRLSGRWFVKQDHQGPLPGYAHPGIVATGLIEAVDHLAGPGASLRTCELTFAPGRGAPVGTFCDVEATERRSAPDSRILDASAFVEGRLIASVSAVIGLASAPEP